MTNNHLKSIGAHHDQVWQGSPWYGSSVMNGLREITLPEASGRIANQHTIAEILNHMTQWKKFVLEKLRGNAGFDIKVDSHADWIMVNVLDEVAWENIKKQYDQVTRDLLAEIPKHQDDLLDEPVTGRKYTYRDLMEGITEHDIYHLGQIMLLKKIMRDEI